MKKQDGNFAKIIKKIEGTKSTFNQETKTIKKWVQEHLDKIGKNERLITENSDESKLKIFCILSTDLLMRAIQGERGDKIKEVINDKIKNLNDLNSKTYKEISKSSGYRFPKGLKVVLEGLETYFKKINYNWETYFKEANKMENIKEDFSTDELREIKYVSFKVRDLALSNFNKNYVAIDINVVRVITRLGLIDFGYDIVDPPCIEMGNNPSKTENYLFMHHLLKKLADDSKLSLVEIDRAFWHFGRTVCKTKPKCKECVIKDYCPTGKALIN